MRWDRTGPRGPEDGNVRTRTTLGYTLALSATLAMSSPARAQSENPALVPTTRPDRQVQTFEMVLGRALETAGRNFAIRAAQIAPELTAFPTGENPQVTGVAVRDLGLYVFHVRVPGIDLTLSVMNLVVNRPQVAPRPEAPPRPQAGE